MNKPPKSSMTRIAIACVLAALSIFMTAASCARQARNADDVGRVVVTNLDNGAVVADDVARVSAAELAAANQISSFNRGTREQKLAAKAACEVLSYLEDDGTSEQIQNTIYANDPSLKSNRLTRQAVKTIADKLALVNHGGAYVSVRVRACGW